MRATNRSGYLKRRCTSCGETIYLKKDRDNVWRPYKSWVDGQVEVGEWKLHECPKNQVGTSHQLVAAPQLASAPEDPLLQAVDQITANFGISDFVAVKIVGIVARTLK